MNRHKGALLSEMSWPEVAQWLSQPVVIPIGAAAKEHGPHLPMGTDSVVADALARHLANRLPVLVAPTINLGYYPVFRDFAGSQHLRAETFIAVIEDVLHGFIRQGAGHLLLLNTGVSTEAPLTIAVQRVFDDTGTRPVIADLRGLGRSADALLGQAGGGHADERETALLMAIAPAMVNLCQAPAFAEPDSVKSPGFRYPIRFNNDPMAVTPDFWPTGTSGEPQMATAAKGEAILNAILDDLEAGIRAHFPLTCGTNT